MSFNIVKASEAHITSDVVDRIANTTGESPGKTRQAMSTGILGVIASVVQRGSSAAGAESILGSLKLPLFGGAEKLAASFLGDRGDHVTDIIAKTNGIGRPAAYGVMSAVLPLVASALGHEVTSNKLDAGGLVNLLRSQKDKLLAVPGIGTIAGTLGLTHEHEELAVSKAVELPKVETPKVERPKVEAPKVERPKVEAPVVTKPMPVAPAVVTKEVAKEVAPVSERKAPLRTPAPAPVRAAVAERPTHVRTVEPARVTPHTAPVRTPDVEHVERKRSWLPIALGIAALGLGALLFGRRLQTSHEPATPVAEAPRVEPGPVEPMAPPAAVPEPTAQTTITSAEVVKETVDDPLKTHFEGKAIPDKVTLSDVTFDFGTTKLASGEKTVEHITELMKEHPTTRVRLEGHTDSVGSAPKNVDLSLKRALAVRKALIDKGIDGRRILAVGVGELAPVAPNDTDEGRAKNRRIDAVIVKR